MSTLLGGAVGAIDYFLLFCLVIGTPSPSLLLQIVYRRDQPGAVCQKETASNANALQAGLYLYVVQDISDTYVPIYYVERALTSRNMKKARSMYSTVHQPKDSSHETTTIQSREGNNGDRNENPDQDATCWGKQPT